MRVITEMELRDLYRKQPFDTFTLVNPERLTPSASQFLSERRIKLIEENTKSIVNNNSVSSNKQVNKEDIKKKRENFKGEGYMLYETGEEIPNKPEAFTHLSGKYLIPKNHKRIKFRGKIDLLEASLVNTIVDIQSIGYKDISKDLTIVFEYIKKMLRAEVLDEELEFVEYKGLTDEQIRDQSHYPDKYFGVKHFSPDPKYGKIMAMINLIRAQIRELETFGVDAFYNEDTKEIERPDIILGLNRLSSIVYIIMCQYLSKYN